MLKKFKKLCKNTQPTEQDFVNYLSYLKAWLLTELKKAKKDGFVFGLSGGIDSSLLAVIVHEAMNGKNYLAVMMPLNNLKIDEVASKLLIKKFKLKNTCLKINVVLEAQLSCLKDQFPQISEQQKRLVTANIKARLRTLNLYALAQSLNYLVLGTTNYDEWTTGYFSKYGDSACDLAPLRYLLKSDIFALAKLLKVPKQIILRRPTAALYKGQFDEKELGFTYAQLDQVLSEQVPPTARMTDFFRSSAHKRMLPLAPGMFRDLVKKL